MLIIKNDNDDTIPVKEMKDGQIGVIAGWLGDQNHHYNGRIVQYYGNKLVVLGKESGYSFSAISQHEGSRVKILSNGTLLEVQDNE